MGDTCRRFHTPCPCSTLHPTVNHADFWVVMFLAVGLKLPLIGLFYVIWKAAKLGDQAHAERGSTPVSRMALCGYCGTRIRI